MTRDGRGARTEVLGLLEVGEVHVLLETRDIACSRLVREGLRFGGGGTGCTRHVAVADSYPVLVLVAHRGVVIG